MPTYITPLRLARTAQEPGVLAVAVDNCVYLPDDKSQQTNGQHSSDDSEDHSCHCLTKTGDSVSLACVKEWMA